jgi:soluble cytochrome b562
MFCSTFLQLTAFWRQKMGILRVTPDHVRFCRWTAHFFQVEEAGIMPVRTHLRICRFILLLVAAGFYGPLHSVGFAHGPDKEQTPLGEEMEIISKNIRSLRRQILDPSKKEASLKLVEGMQASAAKAKELVPTKAKEIAEAEREKFVSAYRARMGEFVEGLEKISAEIREGRLEEAKLGLSKLHDLKRRGHEQFSAEPDDE